MFVLDAKKLNNIVRISRVSRLITSGHTVFLTAEIIFIIDSWKWWNNDFYINLAAMIFLLMQATFFILNTVHVV